MSDRLITAEEAKRLLDGTGLRGCEVGHYASYDPEEKYPLGARDLVYIDGDEDVDGLGNFQPTGGPICNGVPAEVAPLFAAAPDLAATVIAQAGQIDKVREVRSMLNKFIKNMGLVNPDCDEISVAKLIVNELNDALGDTDD